MTTPQRLVVIGAGPCGYTASIYAARAGLAPILIRGDVPGGQLTITTDVENYPGFVNIQGPALMEAMEAQARHVGVTFVEDHITHVDFSQPQTLTFHGHKAAYGAGAAIIATGAAARWLDIPSETHFRGAGVSACATCDGFFFRGKDVGVVGGGNTAVEEALFLTNHATSVTLIHRRDSLRAEKMLQDRLKAHPKIRIIWNSAVDEILGAEQPTRAVTGVRLRDTVTGALNEIPLQGLFVAIGHVPNTSFLKGSVALDPEGYVVGRGPGMHTEIPGLFAAGDVRDKVYRQAVTAAGQGCMAALDAEKYLAALR